MGVSPLMTLGVKAMAASYAALQTTGNNIANASVAGYSRQTVEVSTSSSQYTGAGYFGRGVDVDTVSRAYDGYLRRQADNASSVASMDKARYGQLQRLEELFPTGEQGLGYASSELMDAFVDLASQPADGATRRVVLARAEDLASRFNEAAAGLDELQAGVRTDLQASVASVNSLAASIAEANRQIVEARGSQHTPNDLLDERDRLVAELSTHLQVTRIEASDGSLSIFVAGGQNLVLGAASTALSVVADPVDGRRAAVAFSDGQVTRVLDPDDMGGGDVAGLLRFQNEDLVQGRVLIGQMALALGSAFNAQQQLGVNLQSPLGSVASDPMFSFGTVDLGAIPAMANRANARDTDGNLLGSVSMEITDAQAVQASEYTLALDADSLQWQLTRLADGKVTAVNDGDVVDGMAIHIGGSPQGGDSFLLQPVSHLADQMTALLTDPLALAAASPLIASTGSANTGTLKVDSVGATALPLPAPDQSAQITFDSFDSATGIYDYSWQMLDTDGNVVDSGGPAQWSAGQTISGINGFALKLGGAPKVGDTVTVSPTPTSALSTNNGNALALQALRDATVVGGRTATDAWSLALSDIGVRVQSAETASGISTSVAEVSESARSSATGVSLDEEAARLIQYQQAYQAAAKVLQVAQTLFDTLLNSTAG